MVCTKREQGSEVSQRDCFCKQQVVNKQTLYLSEITVRLWLKKLYVINLKQLFNAINILSNIITGKILHINDDPYYDTYVYETFFS